MTERPSEIDLIRNFERYCGGLHATEKGEAARAALLARFAELREALKLALPFLINDSPGGCTGKYRDCPHCDTIRKVKAALRTGIES